MSTIKKLLASQETNLNRLPKYVLHFQDGEKTYESVPVSLWTANAIMKYFAMTSNVLVTRKAVGA